MQRVQLALTLALGIVLALALVPRSVSQPESKWVAKLARVERLVAELDVQAIARTETACEDARLELEALRIRLDAASGTGALAQPAQLTEEGERTDAPDQPQAEPQPTPDDEPAFAKAGKLIEDAERLGRWDDAHASSLRAFMHQLSSSQQAAVMENLYPLINSGRIEVTALGPP